MTLMTLPQLWPLPAAGFLFGLLLLVGANLLYQKLKVDSIKYLRPVGLGLVILSVIALMAIAGIWAMQAIKDLTSNANIQGDVQETSTVAQTETPIPTATPEPSPTATPQPSPTATLPAGGMDPACMPDSKFGGDITIPDDTEFTPGTQFTKTWLLRSTGCAAWPENSRLVFDSGELMNGPDGVAVPPVAPEDSTEVSITLTAPAQPGTYISWWQLESSGGVRYGNKIYVRIIVKAPQG